MDQNKLVGGLEQFLDATAGTITITPTHPPIESLYSVKPVD